MRQALWAPLLLAGCLQVSAPGVPQAPAPGAPSVTLQPDCEGLAVLPTEQRIDFGRFPAGVIAALDRELGPHRGLELSGCPAGVVAQLGWGGLVLSFSDERFVGWRENGAQSGRVCAG